MKSNDTLKTIYNRKSVRSFTDKPVTKEQLTELMRAGMAAPSARNVQPWVFIGVTNRDLLDELADKLPYAKMLFNAPAAIVVCGVPVTPGTYTPPCIGFRTVRLLHKISSWRLSRWGWVRYGPPPTHAMRESSRLSKCLVYLMG